MKRAMEMQKQEEKQLQELAEQEGKLIFTGFTLNNVRDKSISGWASSENYLVTQYSSLVMH